MTMKISVLALTVCLIVGLSAANALAINNVQYLGKATFTVTITHSTDPDNVGASFPMTGALSKVGDEFYLFQGYVTPTGDGPFVVSGSGFKMGSTLFFTLAESQLHASPSPWRDGGVMHVEIDTSNNPWTGTFYDIGHDFDSSTVSTTKTFDSRYTDGTVSGSPVPLNPSVVAPQLLLLQ